MDMDIVEKQLDEKKQKGKKERDKAKEKEKERGIHLYFSEIGRYGELLLKYEGGWEVESSILSKNASVSTSFSNIEPFINIGLFGSEEKIDSSDTESFGKYKEALEYFLELFEKHKKNSIAYIDNLTKKIQKRKQNFTINTVFFSFSAVITGILLIAIILSTGNPKLLAVIIMVVIATAIASIALGATLWDNYDEISLLQGRKNSAKKIIKEIEAIK
jgi:hypothetical protein